MERTSGRRCYLRGCLGNITNFRSLIKHFLTKIFSMHIRNIFEEAGTDTGSNY